MFFYSRITYACPIGHIIENPYDFHMEQKNPIPLEQVGAIGGAIQNLICKVFFINK